MTSFLKLLLLVANFAYVITLNCHQEKDTGVNCDNKPITIKFYFDVRTNVCQPLFYRGCSGNDNRFDTRAACSDACVPRKENQKQTLKKSDEKTEDEAVEEEDSNSEEDELSEKDKDMTLVVNQCKLPTDAKILTKAQKCDQGCPTGYRCTKKNFCCPYKDHVCSLPAASGSERIAFKHYGRYAYQPGLKNCIRFSYFGEGGNFNNFLTYNQCKKFCMDNK
uniref:BPTI/Kunitz inhibitor domain-containing protein n=1 Tax=Caenorhabditis japonica TaxID=281687 RepID=A0A8R1DMY7_CAEJA